MITLTDLRALLERALTHAENPAIVRLTDWTVEGVARAYLPYATRVIVTIPAGRSRPEQTYTQTASLVAWLAEPSEGSALDLTDPGTTHALLVALALALGLDPGPAGLSVRWTRYDNPGPHDAAEHAWIVWGGAALAGNTAIQFVDRLVHRSPRLLLAPTIAAEPDPIKALALAVRHVLENP